VATPQETKPSIHQALKGRNTYVALSGLEYVCVSVTQGDALGYCIAPLRGFHGRLHFEKILKGRLYQKAAFVIL
jgi:hypothetical protein